MTYYLKVPLPVDLAQRLAREYHPSFKWRIRAPMQEHWFSLPEYQIIRSQFVFEERVEGFDLSLPNPWVCIAFKEMSEIDDEIRMLMLLKFDLSTTQHRPQVNL